MRLGGSLFMKRGTDIRPTIKCLDFGVLAKSAQTVQRGK